MFPCEQIALRYTRWLCLRVYCRLHGLADNTPIITFDELADYEPEGVA